MARNLATFKAAKTNGSDAGRRTPRYSDHWPAAYERISSIDSGRTEVSPRSVLTSTGKKHSTAAMVIFDQGLSVPNHAFVIGAKAMIGIAFAAIMYGISAEPSGRQRESARAERKASELPIANPATASFSVIQARSSSRSRLSPNAVTRWESGGSR